MDLGVRRWLALCGIAAPVLLTLAFFVVGGSPPNDTATAAKVVAFYRDHKTTSVIDVLMITVSAVLVALFAARLREVLDGGARAEPLSVAAFAGAIIFAIGLLLGAAIHFAIVQAADHRLAQTAQTLNALNQDDFIVETGGVAILFLASGIATVMRPELSRWFGWVTIVAGVITLAAFTGPIGFLLALVWLLVAAIVVVARHDLFVPGAAITTRDPGGPLT